ncbi:hypothetical protein [Sphingomonas sp.]|uniref:hypothetical protein n=1 Tax=Sphingomonas sp. TaxID=28214 RepID=UPI00286A2B96|nr:hypothetical protein [Sphingomonas sp.]
MSDIRSNMRPNVDEQVHLGDTTEVLKGSWVGTFDALRLVDPPQGASSLPMLPNYAPLTVMMCVRFDSTGNVTGETRRNTSDNQIARDAFAGTASIREHAVFQWGEGAFTIVRDGKINEVQFVLRSVDEMQIILGSSSGTLPGNLAQCILKRVP